MAGLELRSPAAATLAGIAVALLIGAAAIGANFLGSPPRPAASGDIGVLAVYAQTPDGPVLLALDERRALRRPQDFAFQFSCEGTGPRLVRIETRAELETRVVHEEKLACPAELESLEFVLTLGEEAPNELSIRTSIEAPHDHVRVHEFPVRLGGR